LWDVLVGCVGTKIVAGQLDRAEHVIRRFDRGCGLDGFLARKVACERLSLKTHTTRSSASLCWEKLKRSTQTCGVEISSRH
jgi:hypothetical protein